MFFENMNHYDLKRLSLVSKYFNEKIKNYMKYNKKFEDKNYLYWFNKNFCYYSKEKDLINKKEGETFKKFFDSFVYSFNICYNINFNRTTILKKKLIKCSCDLCYKKLSNIQNHNFPKILKFNSLFHYMNSYKFDRLSKDKIISKFAINISKIINLNLLKSKKILLLFLLTRGIKNLYNSKYYSVRNYCINIKMWKRLQHIYYIFINTYNYVISLISNEDCNQINKIISTYFVKDECIRYLFIFIDGFISINKKRKSSFIDQFINL